MTNSCPDCGAEIEFTVRPAQIRAANCGACGHAYTLYEEPGSSSATGLSGAPGTPEEASEVEGNGAKGLSLPCPACGGALGLTLGPDGRLAGACDDCDEEFVYVRSGPGAPPERESRRPSFNRGPMGGEGPRSRPCRECGAPLRFSTGPDGTVEAACTSCDNRFTLPPRRFPREGGRFERPFRGPPRGRGEWSPPRRGGPRSFRGPPRARPRSDGDGDEDSSFDRRRRRRPREE